MVKGVESALKLFDHDTEYFNMGFECTARVLVLYRNFFWVPTYFYREVMSMEGHGIPWWEPLFRVCVICMVCASLCSRPCYISPFVGRYVESYVARASPMSQWCAPKRYTKSTAHIVHLGGLTERPTSATTNFFSFSWCVS